MVVGAVLQTTVLALAIRDISFSTQSWNWVSPCPNLLVLGFRTVSVEEAAWPGNSEVLRQEKVRPRCREGEQSLGGRAEAYPLPSPPVPSRLSSWMVFFWSKFLS